jgi:hypothetical protein
MKIKMFLSDIQGYKHGDKNVFAALFKGTNIEIKKNCRPIQGYGHRNKNVFERYKKEIKKFVSPYSRIQT